MITPPNCYKRNCKHFLGVHNDSDPFDESAEVVNCLAFPEGIPDEIAYGVDKHLKKVKGQVGKFVFEERE